MRQQPPDWLPDIVASPSLPHSCPQLLGTTSADFRSRTPLTSQKPNSSHFTLYQLCKGSMIIGVRTRQSLRSSWIQIWPIITRLQMSARRHMARPMNLWQWRITPIDQQVILQKDSRSATKAEEQPRKVLDNIESYQIQRIIHVE